MEIGCYFDDPDNYIESDIDAIILYDQLSRHYFTNYGKHVIEYYLQKALKILLKKPVSWFESLDTDEWYFALLPFRHSLNISHQRYAMDRIWKEIKYRNGINKFVRATYDRCIIDTEMIYHENNNGDTVKGVNVLSLSGGVDSMVCSKICGPFRCAVFINYMNRPNSIEDEEFVIEWCRKINLNLYIRRIDEIKRKDCMTFGLREVYETYTKNVRFACYKKIRLDENESIVMGHNKDDVIENIFTNIAKKQSYENLHGMNTTSIVGGIKFHRPMMHLRKDDIYDIADKLDIQHLSCSTPIWSQRGKIRNTVLPAISEWNNEFINGLMSLSSVCQTMHDLFDNIIDTYIDQYTSHNHISVNLSKSYWKQTRFWKLLFEKTITTKQPSYKSIDALITRISMRTASTFELTKDTRLRLTFNNPHVIIHFDKN
jgi:tRNA(Ile)-lysidine synthetase-like protein